MKSAATRCYEMLALGTKGSDVVKRLSAEFSESFWQQGDRIMEEFLDARGQRAHRCIGLTLN